MSEVFEKMKVVDCMRKMFLLYGAPGSGKTRFASLAFAYSVTISRSDFERIVTPTLPALDGCSHIMSNSNRSMINSMIEDAVLARAKQGYTIVLDDPDNTKLSNQKKWLTMLHGYGYEVILVDVQGDKTLSEISKVARITSTTPLKVVEKYYTNAEKHPALRVIASHEEFMAEFFTPTTHYGNSPVMVVGDVQSSSTRLQKLVDTYDTPAMRWVFTGDLTDRGENPAETIRIVQKLGNRTVKVMGNHDEHLYDVLREPRGDKYVQTRETVKKLYMQGFTRDHIMKWVNGFVPFHDFTVGDKRFFASHGGVSLNSISADLDGVTVSTIPTDMYFIQGARDKLTTHRGVGMYAENIDFLLAISSDSNPWFDAQFHGHRNSGHATPSSDDTVFNLESRAEEADGHLTSALITKNSITPIFTT